MLAALAFATVVAAAATAAPDPQRVQAVGCSLSIQTQAQPDTNGRRLVLGRVWLPRATTVLRLHPARPGSDVFLKFGLYVRSGPPVVLDVPAAWRRVYSLVYGANAVSRVAGGQWRDTVQACAPPAPSWTVWAGGYEVRRGVCAPLKVRSSGRSARVWLSLGKRCS